MVFMETATAAATVYDSSDDEQQIQYDSSPFKIDWLNISPEGNQSLGISALPGRKFKEVWRKLEKDVAYIQEEGVEDVFVLCTRGEMKKYRVPTLLQEYNTANIQVHHHPFPDGSVPSETQFLKILEELRVCLLSGKKTLVHCYGGLGRSGLLAACLLLLLDSELQPDDAINKVKQLRGPSTVQTIKQYNFIQDFRKIEKDHCSKEERSISR